MITMPVATAVPAMSGADFNQGIMGKYSDKDTTKKLLNGLFLNVFFRVELTNNLYVDGDGG